MHGAMANCVRVKQVASEASRVSSASGHSGRKFFFFPMSSGKKICIRTYRLHPDAPEARTALDVPWQGTYRSQCKTHRQCEFGHSTPWHRAFGRHIPGCHVSGRSSPWHLLTGRSVSGHFPSGRSLVRAFSFWTQPCQGIFLLDTAVSEQFPSGRSRVRAIGIWTTRVMAPQSICLSRYGTSLQILLSHSQTRSGFQA